MNRFIDATPYGLLPVLKDDKNTVHTSSSKLINDLLQLMSATGDGLLISIGKYYVIDDIKIPNNSGLAGTVGINPNYPDTCTILIADNLITPTIITGSTADNNKNITIKDLQLYRVGIEFTTSESSNVTIEGNCLYGPIGPLNNSSIVINKATNLKISKNYFLREISNPGGGVWLSNDTNTIISENYFGDIRFLDDAVPYIPGCVSNMNKYLTDSIGINSATDYGHFNYAIYSVYGSKNLKIYNNYIHGNNYKYIYDLNYSFSMSRLAAIYIKGFEKSSIYQNYISGWATSDEQVVIQDGEQCLFSANYMDDTRLRLVTESKSLSGFYIINNRLINREISYKRNKNNNEKVNLIIIYGNKFENRNKSQILISSDDQWNLDITNIFDVEATNTFTDAPSQAVKNKGVSSISATEIKQKIPAEYLSELDRVIIIPDIVWKVFSLSDNNGFPILTNQQYIIEALVETELDYIYDHYYFTYDFTKKIVKITENQSEALPFSFFADNFEQIEVRQKQPLTMYCHVTEGYVYHRLSSNPPTTAYPNGSLTQSKDGAVLSFIPAIWPNDAFSLSLTTNMDDGYLGLDLTNMIVTTKKQSTDKRYKLQFLVADTIRDYRNPITPYPQLALFFRKKRNNMGSGVFISSNKILTAAHVAEVIDREGKEKWSVYSGYREPGNITPDLIIEKITIQPEYISNADDTIVQGQYDIAVIQVKKNSEYYFSISELLSSLNKKQCTWTGYPSDKSVDINNKGQFIPQSYTCTGELSATYGQSSYLASCQTFSSGGQSGSGLISAEGDDMTKVIGVLSSGDRFEAVTHFTLLTGDNYTFVSKLLKDEDE